MSNFLVFVFIFYIGSTLGWIFELFYRRIEHKKWVNPGFLVGPYLPIYGFGLVTLTFLHFFLSNYRLSAIVIIILTGLILTLIELVAGLIFIKGGKVKLWDYSDRWLNYKGIICPQFSLIWTILGAIYYYFLADKMVVAISWFSENLSFSFILGIFFGAILIDFVYSTRVLVKVRKFAKENKILVRYEELKGHIQDIQKDLHEKYSFVFPFKQTRSLKEYLNNYKENNSR